jgi:hypothetical protein
VREEDIGAGNRESGIGKQRTAILFRVLIGAILVTTGVGKLLDVAGFARVLGTYRTFADSLLLPIAVLVPVAELLLALWLFSAWRPFAAAMTALAMHLTYAGWSASAVLRGLKLENCGCFGVFLPRRLGWSTVAEDLVAAALCGTLAVLSPKRRGAA